MLEKALAAAGEARMVVIEDPERPVQDGELSALLEAAAGAHAAVPAMAVRDTYKRVRGGVVVETVPREGLVELLGPWIFERGALEGAMARVRVRGSGQPCRSAVDLCRLAGVSVRLLRWPATA